MIFSSRNETGRMAWQLVLEGRKTITRRLKPMPVGKEFPVQPPAALRCKLCGKRSKDFVELKDWTQTQFSEFFDNPDCPKGFDSAGYHVWRATGRSGKAVCRAKVISCMTHTGWLGSRQFNFQDVRQLQRKYTEARMEGFESWFGLFTWFEKKKIPIEKTWRIEFQVISDTDKAGLKRRP